MKRWIIAPIVVYLYLNKKYTKINFFYKFLIESSQEDRDIKNLFDKTKPILKFTAQENKFGIDELERMGLKKNSKFVCLTVRDSAYLKSHFPDIDCSYHNYRDSDVKTYIKAANYLTSKGIYVIRMGAKVNKSIVSNNPMIIDYATNGMRSEFMDVFLGAHCLFCISQGTGFDGIPIIFRRPVVFVNLAPVLYLHTSTKKSVTIFKHFISEQTNKNIKFSEIFNSSLGQCLTENCFKSKGVFIQDNSSTEILEAIQEMYERLLNDTWRDQGISYEQSLFWNLFPKNICSEINNKPLHGNIKSLIGQKYLEKMRDYIS